MKPTSILAGAAIAGLMTGSFAVQAHASNSTSKAGTSLRQMADDSKKDVHSCKGQNSCKGKGFLEMTRKEQLRILTRLTDAVTFEEFIRKKFIGAKSFSLEGSESLIPLLDLAIEKAGDYALEIRAVKKAKGAVMDVRPGSKDRLSARMRIT